ncbi:MAG TPA: hypothetical protein VGD81_17535 [Opitutaceae bacterium]
MQILAFVLLAAAMLVSLVYGIQLLILAFRKSVLWGLGYLLVPFVSLIFIIVHWDDAKRPFLKSLIAIPLFLIAAFLTPLDFPE